MASAFLTRRITFAAAHRYRRPEWSDEENERVFGLCARPNYHGHSYVCEVTVRGEIDATTGTSIWTFRSSPRASWCRPVRTSRVSSTSALATRYGAARRSLK